MKYKISMAYIPVMILKLLIVNTKWHSDNKFCVFTFRGILRQLRDDGGDTLGIFFSYFFLMPRCHQMLSVQHYEEWQEQASWSSV